MFFKTYQGFCEIIAEDENDNKLLKKLYVSMKVPVNEENRSDDFSLQEDGEGRSYLLLDNQGGIVKPTGECLHCGYVIPSGDNPKNCAIVGHEEQMIKGIGCEDFVKQRWV